MKHKNLFTFLVVVGGVFLLIGGGIYHFFFSMNSLPQGEYVCESTSPKRTYTVKLYIVSDALSVDATRGEVTNNKTGKKKNIYWEYERNLYEAGIMEDTITWENDETVVINRKRLNVKKDTYDWRRE